MIENQKKLMKILEEMFQFDQSDLDFGIYRIMSMKREEIKKFLNEDLMAQITEDLKELLNTSSESQIESINKEIENARAMNISETIKSAMIAELEEKKKALNSQGNIGDIEGDIYSHLTNFFERYYDEGDFISQRRYKDGAYAIPYEGEEVKLHWANADQYYIKTSEYFKDYTFKTGYGNSVHFKIVEAETDKDNNKANEKRFFQLYTEKPFEVKDNELIIYFEYKNGGKKNQNECIAEVIAAFTMVVSTYPNYTSLLSVKDGKLLLERQLIRYTARNSFDYFIHKDLGKFLNRELDFYIKNDVVFLDDIDEQDDNKTKLYLVKAKVIRKIAKKIIAFLAQIEDFQKKLWLKKKFVVETNYCITLDRVPKKIYDEIITNKDQIEEWKKLFAIDEIKGDLPREGFSEPLSKEFLEQNKFLVLDTAFFSNEFKEILVDSIDGLDERLDGLLIHSENFQALNLLQKRYENQIQCVYIDPPYNTDGDGFIYKDNYRDSSWISMMFDRLRIAKRLQSDNSVLFESIGNEEVRNLKYLSDEIYGNKKCHNVIHWKKNQKPQNASSTMSESAEYILVYFNKILTKLVRPMTGTREDEEGSFKPSPLFKFDGRERRIQTIPKGTPIETNNWKKGILKAVRNTLAYIEILDEPIIKDNKIENDVRVKGEWCVTETNGAYQKIVNEGRLFINSNGFPNEKSYRDENSFNVHTNLWTEFGYNELGKALIDNIFGISDLIKYPKPVELINEIIKCINDKTAYSLDYFAGSGTTGHAVINLNREDEGNRKYILVEMGEYFDIVTKPRIEKVIYSEDWKDGKPVSRKGSSHAFKYIRLESYEDTLNNLQLTNNNINLFGNVSEQYLINYMLDIETRDSDSLLNIDKFDKPFNYSMKITKNLETTIQNIDLVETFNYLIGITVLHSAAIKTYDADFQTGEYGAVTAMLKNGDTYKIKMIEGKTSTGESVLVIWRELNGNAVKDNAVLDAFFAKKKISSTAFEYKKIYVNGDNNLPNLRTENEGWKVILIEEEMKKRMFENID